MSPLNSDINLVNILEYTLEYLTELHHSQMLPLMIEQPDI